MNDFGSGFGFGRFFCTWIINEDFCGFDIRIGKEKPADDDRYAYHISIQIGYGRLAIGIVSNERD